MKPITLLAPLFLLAACAPLGAITQSGSVALVDFQYSRSSGLGIQNAARYPAGTVFVWNKRENTLAQWTSLSLPLLASSTASDGESSQVSGFGLDAKFLGAKLEIEAAVGRSAKFEAMNVVRKDYEKGAAPLRSYVASLSPEDQADLVETLGVGDPDIRLVVITTVVEVATSKFFLGGIDATAGSSVGKLTLKTNDAALGEVQVKLASNLSCKASGATAGSGAPCFFDVTVFQVNAGPSGDTVRFRQDFGDKSGLLDAFRKGLKGS